MTTQQQTLASAPQGFGGRRMLTSAAVVIAVASLAFAGWSVATTGKGLPSSASTAAADTLRDVNGHIMGAAGVNAVDASRAANDTLRGVNGQIIAPAAAPAPALTRAALDDMILPGAPTSRFAIDDSILPVKPVGPSALDQMILPGVPMSRFSVPAQINASFGPDPLYEQLYKLQTSPVATAPSLYDQLYKLQSLTVAGAPSLYDQLYKLQTLTVAGPAGVVAGTISDTAESARLEHRFIVAAPVVSGTVGDSAESARHEHIHRK